MQSTSYPCDRRRASSPLALFNFRVDCLCPRCTPFTDRRVLLILACHEVHIGDPPARYVVIDVPLRELSICHVLTILGGQQSGCDNWCSAPH